jgi:hypothetical protein
MKQRLVKNDIEIFRAPNTELKLEPTKKNGKHTDKDKNGLKYILITHWM